MIKTLIAVLVCVSLLVGYLGGSVIERKSIKPVVVEKLLENSGETVIEFTGEDNTPRFQRVPFGSNIHVIEINGRVSIRLEDTEIPFNE